MANNYSNCEKKYDRQLAAAFAVYMMAGSAFKKCICRNPLEEGHLCLHYWERDAWRQWENFSVKRFSAGGAGNTPYAF